MRCFGERIKFFGGAVQLLPHAINVVVHLWLAIRSDTNINRRALSGGYERCGQMWNPIPFKKGYEQLLIT